MDIAPSDIVEVAVPESAAVQGNADAVDMEFALPDDHMPKISVQKKVKQKQPIQKNDLDADILSGRKIYHN